MGNKIGKGVKGIGKGNVRTGNAEEQRRPERVKTNLSDDPILRGLHRQEQALQAATHPKQRMDGRIRGGGRIRNLAETGARPGATMVATCK
jgi:hypothetical protein